MDQWILYTHSWHTARGFSEILFRRSILYFEHFRTSRKLLHLYYTLIPCTIYNFRKYFYWFSKAICSWLFECAFFIFIIKLEQSNIPLFFISRVYERNSKLRVCLLHRSCSRYSGSNLIYFLPPLGEYDFIYSLICQCYQLYRAKLL